MSDITTSPRLDSLTLGHSDLEISRLGLGCMGMSDFYGPRDQAQSIETLHGALDLGVTFFDTADMYGPHTNERLLGEAFKGRWQTLKIATKFAIVRTEDPSARIIRNDAPYIRQACEESLKRLGTDHIDLYYMHRRNRDIPFSESIGAMKALVEAGKVGALGLSEVTAAELREAHAIHPISALQTEYSLWSREPEADLIETCRELGVTFVAYSPLGRGYLTGALPTPDQMADDDWRKVNPRFTPEAYEANRVFIDLVTQIAEQKNATPAQVAIAWVLHQAPHIASIPGTRKLSRLKENLGALELRFTADELSDIRKSLPPETVGARY